MDNRIIPALSAALAVLLTVSGCTSAEEPVVTPLPATVPPPETTVPPAATEPAKPSLEPGPVETLPAGWDLSVTVEKSGMYSRTIIAHFDGGKGLMYASRMDLRVTSPDGTVQEKSLVKPRMGDTVEILGSTGTDRVEVSMLMASGTSYRIIDQLMPYKGR